MAGPPQNMAVFRAHACWQLTLRVLLLSLTSATAGVLLPLIKPRPWWEGAAGRSSDNDKPLQPGTLSRAQSASTSPAYSITLNKIPAEGHNATAVVLPSTQLHWPEPASDQHAFVNAFAQMHLHHPRGQPVIRQTGKHIATQPNHVHSRQAKNGRARLLRQTTSVPDGVITIQTLGLSAAYAAAGSPRSEPPLNSSSNNATTALQNRALTSVSSCMSRCRSGFACVWQNVWVTDCGSEEAPDRPSEAAFW